MNDKPLGHKSYGSIGHLPASRLGPADHCITEGQSAICTERCRPGDTVIVTEKLDGSNVAILRQGSKFVAINRAGYLCESSPHEQHRMFAAFVDKMANRSALALMLADGERLCGEWLALAHGTRYRFDWPFVAFDIMRGHERLPYLAMVERAARVACPTVPLLHMGKALPVAVADAMLGEQGYYHAIKPDRAEGVVYRVEQNGHCDFLAKWVRPTKTDGSYLVRPGETREPVWNWRLPGWTDVVPPELGGAR